MESIFIIEHLEPELFPWCIYEYEHISKIVGSNNLFFTNIKKSDASKLSKFGSVFDKSVKDLKLEKVCVLDPESNTTLSASDKSKFQYFVFGGILGDYPPKKRTKAELTKFLPQAETRNIGKAQMATDNAVFVTKEILNGKSFSDLKFQDNLTIQINKIESTDLPYRYVLKNGKPLISEKVVKYLKNKKEF